MTNVPARLTTMDFKEPGNNPVNAPTYVSARVLAANTHEEITIPAGVSPTGGASTGLATLVRVAANTDIYYSFTGNASIPVDTDDGSACEMIKTQGDPAWLLIPAGATQLSVISAGTAIVTASFYIV